MTRKRFTVVHQMMNSWNLDKEPIRVLSSTVDDSQSEIIIDFTNNKKLADDLCDLLNDLNDEYHTMQELYDFRLILNALLFNEWWETGKYEVYKSKRHYDGTVCFDGEYFIVVAILPSGQVTNHYPIKDWDLFRIPCYDKVKDEFDNHTSEDVLERYKELI